MTVAEWLAARQPTPPAPLAQRVLDAIGADTLKDASCAADVLLGAGERLLSRLLITDPSSRQAALDLLTADSLVTYAFEAASDAPNELPARALEAMRRISALGAEALA